MSDFPIPPKPTPNAFNCPHCGAFAEQVWVPVYSGQARVRGNSWPPGSNSDNRHNAYKHLGISVCASCRKEAIWHKQRIVYPDSAGAPLPNPDLSDAIKADYLEAASIVQRSPRGAAALLRLCVQKLCEQLGQPGKNINADIAALVKDGLPIRIQQALDAVRVIGNNAVHPGEIDLRDDVETAMTLFGLVNLIADNRISEPKRVAEVFNMLPETKRAEIERRDNKQQGGQHDGHRRL
jgi:hypothetical protein